MKIAFSGKELVRMKILQVSQCQLTKMTPVHSSSKMLNKFMKEGLLWREDFRLSSALVEGMEQ